MIKIGTQIYLKQDVPQSLILEAQQYALLSVSSRAGTTPGTFNGTSNTINYTTTQDLYDQLDVIMFDYRISAIEFDNVRSWLWGQGVPVESGYRQKATYDTSGNVTNFAIYTSSAMLTKVAELISTYDSTGTVLTTREKYYDTNGTTVLCDYIDTYYYDSTGNFDYADRTVTVA